MNPCTWTENEDGVWETDCGGLFETTDSTPEENEMKFCCYCGGRLKQVINDAPEGAGDD